MILKNILFFLTYLAKYSDKNLQMELHLLNQVFHHKTNPKFSIFFPQSENSFLELKNIY